MPPVNSRNVVTQHYDSGLYHSCPVCQHAIDLDHADALNVKQYMDGFELVEVVEPLDQDFVTAELVEEHDPRETTHARETAPLRTLS